MLLIATMLIAMQAQQGLGTTTPGWKPSFDESRVPALLRGKCEKDWPGDFTMQEACLRNQNEGALALKDIDATHGNLFNRQVEKCTDDWTKVGVPDFAMIAACSRMQIESYFRLNAPR